MNSLEDHPKLNNNEHLVDGALEDVGSFCPTYLN
jgi:hypothetical protein